MQSKFNGTPEWLASVPIAHRGLHGGGIVENTPEAFKNAYRNGYGIEIDVQKAKDGIAVFHDFSLSRLANVNAEVADMTLADLSRVELADGSGIMSINEFLRQIDGQTPVLIEVKKEFSDEGYGMEEILLESLRAYTGPVALQSFNPSAIHFFKESAPEIPRGQISRRFDDLADRFKRESLAQMVFNRITEPHFVSYDIEGIDEKLYAECRDEGRLVLCWTVRTPQQFKRATRVCDNVIFENADLLAEHYR